LRSLDADLRARNGRLTVRSGPPVNELTRLAEEVGAGAIYAIPDYSPSERQIARRVGSALPLQLVGGPTLRHPTDVLTAQGKPYRVFGAYRRTWRSLPLDVAQALLPPERLATPASIAGMDLTGGSSVEVGKVAQPSEAAARAHLSRFLQGDDPPISGYAELRNRLDAPGTSLLSPYLRFGMLSAGEVVRAAVFARDAATNPKARAGADAWIDELIWREFFQAILYHYPDVLARSFRPSTRALVWRDDDAAFRAWREGRTGYPVVDAAMRQLSAEGWLHNRARMIAASFLVKDLLVDWRRGERWFRSQLLDGDPASNNGNWQWVAGTGTDAAPYFRVFNPVRQGEAHDPTGLWVRRWVPELQHVPDRFVHQPWEMDASTQSQAGCRVGRDYPGPIVDHAAARTRALAAYRAARDAHEAQSQPTPRSD
jgi:deoxyribodipyrimidine photo-lyase